MINPRKYKYREIIMTADKKQYDVSEMVENVTWEEPENELAARITFTVKNEKAAQGRISSLAKPGCWIGLLYSYNGGKNNEAVRGRIIRRCFELRHMMCFMICSSLRTACISVPIRRPNLQSRRY